jgi:hypothetical protein
MSCPFVRYVRPIDPSDKYRTCPQMSEMSGCPVMEQDCQRASAGLFAFTTEHADFFGHPAPRSRPVIRAIRATPVEVPRHQLSKLLLNVRKC